MKSFQAQLYLAPLIVVFLSIFQIYNIAAQEEWSDPLPLTDSLANNTNPDIQLIHFNGQQHLFMAWEKSFDSTSTAIYLKNIIGQEDEIEVIADENVHYIHPKIFAVDDYYINDTIFFLFYETDQNGNQDIYYLIYNSEGNFSDPIPFSISPNADIELDYNDQQQIVWIKNSELNYTKYMSQTGTYSDPIIIDTSGCSNPKIALSNYILWEKKNDTISHIYMSGYEGTNAWSDPILVYDNGFAHNLTKDAINHERFAWSAFTDSTWKLLTYDADANDITEFDITRSEPFDPAITEYVVCLKSGQDLLPYYITFPYKDNDYSEIFINQDPWTSNFANLSNTGTENRNPNIFFGESASGYYNCWYMYNIWESFHNEHWQLYYSKTIMCCDGIEELAAQKQFIHVGPNPFSDELIIRYELENKYNIKLEIADIYGKTISTLVSKHQNKGEHSISWSVNEGLANGVYFILLKTDDKVYSQKIIKSD